MSAASLRSWKGAAVVSMLTAGLLAGPLTGTAFAAPLIFTVNTTGNASDPLLDGTCDTSVAAGVQCTLRGAIQEANHNPGPDTIQFNLPSPYKIVLNATGLPAITSPVTIDGTSLPGFSTSGLVIIRVDGANAVTYDFDVEAGGDGTVIEGLEIVRAGSAGVRISASNTTLSTNFIGTTAGSLVNCASGSSCSDNVGVLIMNGSNNTIGGTTPSARNVLSNNSGYGVQVSTSTGASANNTVEGNYIGTNVAGTAALPNSEGVYSDNEGGSDPSGTMIGGTAAGAGNVLSGQSDSGVYLSAGAATVAGNLIGLNAAGTAALPNVGTAGVFVNGSGSTTIGGPTAAARNIISGNNQAGVETSSATGAVTVQGNYIGTTPSGTAGLGNGFDGIYASSTDNLVVSGNVVSGNAANTGNDQIRLDSGSNASIRANTIGLAVDGTTALAPSQQDIELNSTAGTLVDGNVISNSSSYGLYAASTDSLVVTNNKLGTDISGTLDRGNQIGVYLTSATETTIGGPNAGNVISGNDAYGIEANASDDSTIQGNKIGTTKSGTAPLGNSASGIWLLNSSRITIGGTATGAGNVIADNGVNCCESGVYLSSSDNNSLLGNRIGVDGAGNAMGNHWAGVYIDYNSNDNRIGSAASGGGNEIANNADAGVLVDGRDNTVVGNSIHDNSALGLDLNQDGVTANDPGDIDTGSNRLQNFPVLSASVSNATATQITGSLNSRPGRQYQLDFYANTACDVSGHGEGATYLGSSTVTTNGSGNVSFSATVGTPAPAGSQVTATATDVSLGDTSEFSACLADQGGLPAASVANTSAAENAGTMTFTVSLSSAPVLTPVTVAYTTADGTATAPGDYTASSGTVTFNAGETSKPINVPIVNDSVDELDETLTVTLSSPANAVIAGNQGTATGTIQDDDAPPTLSVANAPNISEPDTGSVLQTFSVSLSAPSSLPVTVVAGTVTGTAVEQVDFQATAASITFNPGETVKAVTVPVLGDTLDESNESYAVDLYSPTNATINDGEGIGTIVDNDPPPTVSVGDVTMNEGNSRTTKFVFPITLSNGSSKTIKVVMSTADGTAIAGSDYTAKLNTAVTFLPGVTTKTFIVLVTGDKTVEPNETFTVNIGTATNVTVADGVGLGTIVNDD